MILELCMIIQRQNAMELFVDEWIWLTRDAGFCRMTVRNSIKYANKSVSFLKTPPEH